MPKECVSWLARFDIVASEGTCTGSMQPWKNAGKFTPSKIIIWKCDPLKKTWFFLPISQLTMTNAERHDPMEQYTKLTVKDLRQQVPQVSLTTHKKLVPKTSVFTWPLMLGYIRGGSGNPLHKAPTVHSKPVVHIYWLIVGSALTLMSLQT